MSHRNARLGYSETDTEMTHPLAVGWRELAADLNANLDRLLSRDDRTHAEARAALQSLLWDNKIGIIRALEFASTNVNGVTQP